ncbi:hypothetical protein CEXT_642301 [Caerostris extrusa]|uniref:Uncharacterized protein n=1 Tax=Caerostris extrusa TaxID=172846 RepID=A0AAV4V986_CAEEX|nr:hypothetical protein CEXT_642301 [Caerostris extrusa]
MRKQQKGQGPPQLQYRLRSAKELSHRRPTRTPNFQRRSYNRRMEAKYHLTRSTNEEMTNRLSIKIPTTTHSNAIEINETPNSPNADLSQQELLDKDGFIFPLKHLQEKQRSLLQLLPS